MKAVRGRRHAFNRDKRDFKLVGIPSYRGPPVPRVPASGGCGWIGTEAERAEFLEAELSAALESRERAQREVRELRERLRLVWGMVRQKEQEISQSQAARETRGSIRWPWRRSASPRGRHRLGLTRG